MKLKLITLLLLFMTFSCESQVDLSKKTEFISETKESKSILKLMPNNRFEYSNKEKLADQTSQGRWEKDEKNIIFTSDAKYKSGVIESHEYEKVSSKTEIIIYNTNDNFLIDAGVTINDDDNIGWNVDENGIVSFPKKDVTKITIHYLGEKYNYIIENFSANRFVLKIRVDDLSFKYFDNEKFILEGDLLIGENDKKFRLFNLVESNDTD